VFLNRGDQTAPLAMRASVEHFHALNDRVLILTIETEPVPHVPASRRLTIDDLGYTDDGINHVRARYGYMDEANVPAVLAQIDQKQLEGAPFDVNEASYFLSTIDLCISDEPGMARWRKHLFIATAQITADAAEYFRLPRDRTVIIGSRIEV
jgi:KUP system potassium uptake protein